MITHISFDTETWGKRAGFDMRSLGAVVFNPETGELGEEFYQAVENPRTSPWNGFFDDIDTYRKYDLKRDPQTVEWWAEQSEEAQAAFANPIDLRDGLDRFYVWLMQVTGVDLVEKCDDLRIWSHGAAFDLPITEAACYATQTCVPWFYRAPRDTRTLFEHVGMHPHKCLEEFATGTYHHALDDAKTQAKAIIHAMNL